MKLIMENWRKHLDEKHVNYSGVFLDETSREQLLNAVKEVMEIPDGWEIKADHMTIKMGPLESKKKKKGKLDFSKIYRLGDKVALTVTEVGKSELAMAVKVKLSLPTKNKTPHITIAVNRAAGGKPQHSNDIEEEEYIPMKKLINLEGTVKEK